MCVLGMHESETLNNQSPKAMGTKSVNGIVLTTSHTFQLQKEKQTPKHRAKRCTVVCQRKISQALAASSSYSKLPLACKPPADSQTTGSQAWLPAVPAIPDASAFLAAAAAGALHRRDGLHGRKTNLGRGATYEKGLVQAFGRTGGLHGGGGRSSRTMSGL